MVKRSSPVVVGRLVAVLFVLSSCEIGSETDYRLGVPFREQTDILHCGPASTLMWRLYDGLPEISQDTIASRMGGASCGVSPTQIADAVRHFTDSGFDAGWDFVGSNQMNEFMSRQISSLNARVPVIAVIEGGFHAGVVNGGKWHLRSDGLYQWDFVYFHDPSGFPDKYYAADSWLDTSCYPGTPCSQIVSFFAAKAWTYNLDQYASSIVVGGGSSDPPLNKDL